jgi:lysophospholipase L1-like esterase
MNIIFFGDSICSGQGISIHRGWVTRISKDIEELSTKYKNSVTVISSGVNGDTTRSALIRMPYSVQTAGVDIIVIQFGLNDSNYWKTDNGVPRVSPMAFEANLKEIISRSKIFGAKKIFLNTNHSSTRTRKFPYADLSYEESNKNYSKIIRKIAKKDKEVSLNDVEEYFKKYLYRKKLKVSDTVLKDGLHLSLLGHELYYKFLRRRILSAMKSLLESRVKRSA